MDNYKMKKCDFCTMCLPDGKCFWDIQAMREDDCERAIKRMMKILLELNKDRVQKNGNK